MRIIVIILTVLLWFSAGLAQSTLENIAISKLGDSILVDIILSAPCQYEHSLTKVTPERIVIDLKKTINNWPQKNYTRLPLKTLSGVRTSQYQEKPERVARVVLDVNRPVTYSVSELPSGIRIKLPAVAGENDFALWQARGPQKITELVSEAKPLKAPATEAPKKTAAKAEATAKTEPVEKIKTPPNQGGQASVVKAEVVNREKPVEKAIEKPKPPQESTTASVSPTSKAEKSSPPPPPRKMGTELDVIPQRTIVEYEKGSDRDPFKSLIGQGTAKAVAG
ncbi:MAG: AMIN domain-containing protein, partial [candidate division Zixibacteria bacterium]|nr:AMIN domain-containing protein [candidate division Zixibacteria bacterium]